MGEVIALVNIKGGVAKTISTVTFAEILALAGKKVLVIDMDPQCNATQMFQCQGMSRYTIRDIFMAENLTEELVRKAIIPCEYENIYVLPSSKEHSHTDEDLIYANRTEKEYICKKALSYIKDEYDYILIDSGPTITNTLSNILIAADSIIIPVYADGFSYNGIADLIKTATEITGKYGSSLTIKGILLVNAYIRTNLHKDLAAMYEEEFENCYVPAPIRHDNKVLESITLSEPLLESGGRGNAANDYINAAECMKLIDKRQARKLRKKYGVLR